MVINIPPMLAYTYIYQHHGSYGIDPATLHCYKSRFHLLRLSASPAPSAPTPMDQWRPQRCISHGFRSGKSGENDVVTTFYYTCLTTSYRNIF